jgi:hypothetical protein
MPCSQFLCRAVVMRVMSFLVGSASPHAIQTHNGGQATTDKAETRRLRGNGLADFPTRQDRRLSLSVPRTLASAGASEMPYHRRPGVGPWSSQGVLVLSFTRGLILLPRRCAALQSKTATLAG